MRTAIVFIFLLVLPLGVIPGCSSLVPATVTLSPRMPIKKGSDIFVIAQVQRERIVKSLVDAGFQVSDEWTNDAYSLTVSVGRWRASRACGRVNNVAYVLNGAGRRLMVIKGRGGTTGCEPNVFDDMSRTLAYYAAKG